MRPSVAYCKIGKAWVSLQNPIWMQAAEGSTTANSVLCETMYSVSLLKVAARASIEPSSRKVNAPVATFLIQLNLLTFY